MQQSELLKEMARAKYQARQDAIKAEHLKAHMKKIEDDYGANTPSIDELELSLIADAETLTARLETLAERDEYFFLKSLDVNTAEHIAVWYKTLPLEHHLLVDPELRVFYEHTILNTAIFAHNSELYSHILDRGFRPSTATLIFATGTANADLIYQLMHVYKVKPNLDVLTIAARQGNQELVHEMILQYDLCPNDDVINAANESGNQILVNMLDAMMDDDASISDEPDDCADQVRRLSF